MATYYCILADKAFKTGEIVGIMSGNGAKEKANAHIGQYDNVEHFRPSVMTETEYKRMKSRGWEFYA